MSTARARDLALDARFIELWESGMATEAMAQELGFRTKNALCGYRTRLHNATGMAPPRPSPIQRDRVPTQPRSVRRAAKTAAKKAAKKAAPPAVAVPVVLSPLAWQAWFARQSLFARHVLARAPHRPDCPLRLRGGGLWQCRCGATQPRVRPRVSREAQPHEIDPAFDPVTSAAELLASDQHQASGPEPEPSVPVTSAIEPDDVPPATADTPAEDANAGHDDDGADDDDADDAHADDAHADDAHADDDGAEADSADDGLGEAEPGEHVDYGEDAFEDDGFEDAADGELVALKPPRLRQEAATGCCFPKANVGRVVLFCNQAVEGRGPYCAACHADCYIKPRRLPDAPAENVWPARPVWIGR